MSRRIDPRGSAARRWAWAEIDLAALRHNVGVLRSVVAPSGLWAVVKANGYGHGAVDVARTALDAGADGLCVALVQEGVELRLAGVEAPILVLSEQPPDQVPLMIEHHLTPTAYSTNFLDALAAGAAAAGVEGLAVHVKIDTGMQRVGAPPADISNMLDRLVSHAPTLRLAGVFTHLAVADEPENPFTDVQLARFGEALDAGSLAGGQGNSGEELLVHAANSAAALAHHGARRSFVRAGIAIYGISPGAGVDHLVTELRPVLSLHARIAHVKPVAAGTAVSYGLRHTFGRDTVVATLPIGYADGVPRRLSATGGDVLIGGRRCPIVGAITMDQLVVDCAPVSDSDRPVRVGDRAVLIGEQDGPDGPVRIRAEDWADRLDTIGYEIVCGISARVPRVPRRNIDG